MDAGGRIGAGRTHRPDGWYAAAKLGRSFTTESIALSKAGEVAREIAEMVARQDPDYVRGLLPAEPRRRRLRDVDRGGAGRRGAGLGWLRLGGRGDNLGGTERGRRPCIAGNVSTWKG